MNRVDAIISRVMERESPLYTNNPNDAGGPTKYGITQASLSRYLKRPATEFDVQNITEQLAREYYFWKQVHEPEFDAIVAISEPIGAELIDTGTLCGPARAAQFLQECLNAFNLRGKHYPDIAVDCDAGPATRAALRAYLAQRGDEGVRVMVAALNSKLGSRLLDRTDPKAGGRQENEDFAYGWILHRVLEAA